MKPEEIQQRNKDTFFKKGIFIDKSMFPIKTRR